MTGFRAKAFRATDYLITKFGSVERYAQIAERVKAAAADEGLVYAPDKISRQPNTTDCHRLILWADKTGNAARMKQRLMDLYFTEGGDLTSNEVLAQAAADIGLDRAEIAGMLATDQDVDAVGAAGASRQGRRHRRRAVLHFRRRTWPSRARKRRNISPARLSARRRRSEVRRRRE